MILVRRKLRRLLFSGLALLLFAAVSRADDFLPRAVAVTQPMVELREELAVRADPAGMMSIDQVAAPGAMFGKRPVTTQEIVRNGVYWIRFRLSNPGTAQQAVFIEPGYWNHARLFTKSETGFREQRSGMLVPVEARSVRMASTHVSTFFFDAELPPSTISTFYLRVESDYRFFEPAAIRLFVWDASQLRDGERRNLLYQGIFLGVILALCLYNLVLFLRIHDASYGYYVLFLAGIWIVWANSYNLTLEWLWPAWPVWEFYAPILAEVAIVVGLTQFTRRYLDTPRTLPRVDIVLRIMLASQLLPLVALPFAKYAVVLQMVTISVAMTFLLTLLTAIAAARISHPLAKYFLMANVFSSVGHLIMFTAVFGLIPNFHLANYGYELAEFGVAVEGILLSFGLAYRLRRLSDEVTRQRFAEADVKRQHEEDRRSLIEKQNVDLERKVVERTADLTQERERTESLLHNILPAAVVDELKSSGRTVPRRFEETSILFTDFSDFTQTMGTIPATRMVEELNDIFAAFDDIVDRHGLEKIKTIGDAYLAAAGLPEPTDEHALRCVRAGLDMVQFVAQRNQHSSIKWGLRVGIHSGPVVAGVVGKRKYAYDIWGDTVNIASRMESAGEPGRVNISAYTYDLVRRRFTCEYRGKKSVKGKGEVDMYFVNAKESAS